MFVVFIVCIVSYMQCLEIAIPTKRASWTRPAAWYPPGGWLPWWCPQRIELTESLSFLLTHTLSCFSHCCHSQTIADLFGACKFVIACRPDVAMTCISSSPCLPVLSLPGSILRDWTCLVSSGGHVWSFFLLSFFDNGKVVTADASNVYFNCWSWD